MGGQKNEKSKNDNTRAAHRVSGSMGGKNGYNDRLKQVASCQKPHTSGPKVPQFKLAVAASKLRPAKDLANEFYWCDQRSFYEMQVPYEEAKAFAEASFTFLDNNPDVFNFLPRVRQAQKEAKKYCFWIEKSCHR